MVYRETVTTTTFALIQALLRQDYLKDFFLVGGTALALQIGHRKSADIDLFSLQDFDVQLLNNQLGKGYSRTIDFADKNTLKCDIDGVKTYFITHNYPLIAPLVQQEGIRMAALPDIAAMKLNAIVNSGQRMKDFFYIYFLLEKMSMQALLKAYQDKYARANPILALKAVTYFGDVNRTEPLQLMKRELTWDQVVQRLQEAVRQTTKLF